MHSDPKLIQIVGIQIVEWLSRQARRCIVLRTKGNEMRHLVSHLLQVATLVLPIALSFASGTKLFLIERQL